MISENFFLWISLIGLGWIGLDWVDWIGLDWIGGVQRNSEDSFGFPLIPLSFWGFLRISEDSWIGLGWVGLDWVDWIGPDWMVRNSYGIRRMS